MKYVSRVPRPPSDGLIVNLGAPFRIRAGIDIETAEYADECVVIMPTHAWEFGYPLRTDRLGGLAAGAGHFDQAHFVHGVPGVQRAHADPLHRSRAAVPREHPGRAQDSWPLTAD